MKYNKLSNTDVELSAITLGTWVFGGHFWGGSNENHCIEAVHCAIDHGINCIDTAPIYSNGNSEKIVGKALKGRRDKVILATKCGLSVENGGMVQDLSPQKLKEELDDSLSRLQTDYIDLYQCHWPDAKTPIEDTMRTLKDFKEQGKIKHIGLSNHPPELFDRAKSIVDIVSSQDHYSMLVRDIEEKQLPYLNDNNIGLLAYGSLAGGILTGKYKEAPKFNGPDARGYFYKFYEGDAFKQTQEFLAGLTKIGKPLAEVAINWVRAQKGVTTVLVGSRNADQVERNVKAIKWDLEREDLDIIKSLLKEKIHG